MKIEVDKQIAPVLFEYQSVVLPGLGSFICTYRSAQIDYVQGYLHPPGSSLSFQESLSEDDGRLTEQVKKAYQIARPTAQEEVQKYVAHIEEQLEQREMIVIPEVGRLYRDYEGELQFLEDHQNFDTQTFGLPTVQFYPILRNRESIKTEAVLPVQQTAKPVQIPPRRNRLAWMQLGVPAIFGLLLIAVGLTLFQTQRDSTQADAEFQSLPVVKKPLNQRPTERDQAMFLFADREANHPVLMDVNEAEIGEVDDEEFTESESETDAIRVAPNVKEGIIIVGAFSKKSGAQKRIQQIYDLGYEAYQDQKKGLYRVGIRFGYERSSKVTEVLRVARKRFDEDAWLLK